MHPIIYQNDFTVKPDFRPQRIISLVPSQTEMLHYFGIDERVVGITDFCVHPQHWRQEKTIVGGTKKIDFEKIKSLQPDLVIANKEENVKEQIEELATICPVYVSEVFDLNSVMEMMLQIGLLVDAKMQSEALVHQIANDFDKIDLADQTISVAYLIWRKPYMAAGGNTFINDMLQRCSLQNVFASNNRYPTITTEDLQKANPTAILLSSEPYPFQQKHIDELQQHLPETKMLLVEGEMFSWYGSHLLKTPDYLSQLKHRLLQH